MCDVFGPPLRVRPFRRYQVWRKRSATYVVGIDRVRGECSILRVARKEDAGAGLELLDGEERFPLHRLGPKLQELSRDGGIEKIISHASGIIGFIRFLQGYYLILITKHKKVGKIGHHLVLSIETTALVELFKGKESRDEKAFRDQFGTLNLSKDFYFSHSYELSRTVQQNLADARSAAAGETRRPLFLERDARRHHRFVWNYHHLAPFLAREGWQHWCLPVIHGFFAYTKCSSFGWTFEVVLVARRSRFYAGTRYRKRGLNADGQVANDVETEQLLCDDSVRSLSLGHVMSFVQVRGSVPLFWSQEATALTPRPPVVYPRCDPTLSATRLHFADLLERYGTPQLVINLMKAKKADHYEARLSKNFESAIERINRELPCPARILYRPFDMKNHSKSHPTYDVFARLAESIVKKVGFFHSRRGTEGPPERVQSGVARTNCVDCLDRTNVLQFFVGLEALAQQLKAISLLPEPRLDSESQIVCLLREWYDLMGDHLALRYAGSVAHKKYHLLGSRDRMMRTTQELFTAMRRHYNTSFTDNEKQAAINLFLGVYTPLAHPGIGPLDCDSWVHHRVLRDDYTPGDWWKAPLEAHAKSTGVLQSADPLPALVPLPGSTLSWFQVVHKVWKLTWFDKLLAHLEATFVQIDTSSRRPLSLKPSKVFAVTGKPEQRPAVTAGVDVFCQPQPVDPADLEVYQSYVDPRQINQLLWLQTPTHPGEGWVDLSLAWSSAALRWRTGVDAAAETGTGTASGALPAKWASESAVELVGTLLRRQLLRRAGHERSRQGQRHQTGAEKPERDEARRRLQAILESYKPLRGGARARRPALGRGPSGSPGARAQAGREAEGAPAGARPPPPGGAGEAARARPPAPAPGAPPAALRLCGYCGAPYGAAAPAAAAAAPPGERAERAERAERGAGLCPPHRRRAAELEALLGGRAGPHAPAGAGGCGAAGDAGAVAPGHGGLGAAHLEPRFPPRAQLAEEPAPGRPPAPARGRGPRAAAAAPGPGAALGGAAARPLLWAYAFPRAAPAPPEPQAAGLPAWWLRALERPPAPPQEPAALPLGVRVRGKEQRGKKRSATAAPHPAHPRTPSSHSHEPRPPSSPRREPGRGCRSMFHGEVCRQVFEELLRSGGFEQPSPVARGFRHRRVRSVAF